MNFTCVCLKAGGAGSSSSGGWPLSACSVDPPWSGQREVRDAGDWRLSSGTEALAGGERRDVVWAAARLLSLLWSCDECCEPRFPACRFPLCEQGHQAAAEGCPHPPQELCCGCPRCTAAWELSFSTRAGF